MWLKTIERDINFDFVISLETEETDGGYELVAQTNNGKVLVVLCENILQAAATRTAIGIAQSSDISAAAIYKDDSTVVLASMDDETFTIKIMPTGESVREGFNCPLCGGDYEPERLLPPFMNADGGSLEN